jgi:hypothetical protein
MIFFILSQVSYNPKSFFISLRQPAGAGRVFILCFPTAVQRLALIACPQAGDAPI